MRKWIICVVVGVALLSLSTGAGGDDSGLLKCGSEVMSPGDVCEETRGGVTVDEKTYDEMKASQENGQKIFNSWGRWALLGGGIALVALGVFGIVRTRRQRSAAQAAGVGVPPQGPPQPGQPPYGQSGQAPHGQPQPGQPPFAQAPQPFQQPHPMQPGPMQPGPMQPGPMQPGPMQPHAMRPGPGQWGQQPGHPQPMPVQQGGPHHGQPGTPPQGQPGWGPQPGYQQDFGPGSQ